MINLSFDGRQYTFNDGEWTGELQAMADLLNTETQTIPLGAAIYNPENHIVSILAARYGGIIQGEVETSNSNESMPFDAVN